jgi:hypothetical protein
MQQMFRRRNSSLPIAIGQQIAWSLVRAANALRELADRCYRHVERLGKGMPGVFKTESAIARPEDRALLKRELSQAECLGARQMAKSSICGSATVRKMRRCCASWAACAKSPFARWAKAAANAATSTAMMTIICI